MMEVTYLYLLALSAAFLRLLWVRWPLRWHVAFLAAWTVEALVVTMGPQSGDVSAWLRGMWMWVDAATLALAIAASLEATSRARRFVDRPHVRFSMAVAAWGFAGALVGAGVLFVAPPHGDALEVYRTCRAWIWAALLLAVGITRLLMALRPVVMPWALAAHVNLMVAILAAHAITCWFVGASDAERGWARFGFRVVVIGACAGWITIGRAQIEANPPRA